MTGRLSSDKPPIRYPVPAVRGQLAGRRIAAAVAWRQVPSYAVRQQPYWTVMDREPRPFDMDTVVSEVDKRLEPYDGLIEVSVLGSVRKGVGEARHADFGITGAKDTGMIYARGQPLRTVPIEQLVEELFTEIDKYYAAGKKIVVDDAQAAEAARWLRETEDDTAV